MSAVYTPPYSRQKSAAYTPLFNKCQRHTHRYSTNASGLHCYSTKFSGTLTAIFDKCQRYTPRYSTKSTRTAMYIQCVLAYTFSRHVSPTNLRFSFDSCRFRCIIFVLLLTCLAAFALTLLVCLFACRRKRNDRTRRGRMQRGATLPLSLRLPSTCLLYTSPSPRDRG